MKRTLTICLHRAILTGLLASCVDPHKDLAQMTATLIAAEVRQDEPMYRKRAVEFITLAQKGDVDAMLRITSPLVISNSENGQMRRTWAEQVVPAFVKTSVDWDDRGQLIYDEDNNVGFAFSGVARSDKAMRFYVDMMKVNGNVFVCHLRKTKIP